MVKNMLVLIGLVFAALAVCPAWAEGGPASAAPASPAAISATKCASGPCHATAGLRSSDPLTGVFNPQTHRSPGYHRCAPGNGHQHVILVAPRSTGPAGKELSYER